MSDFATTWKLTRGRLVDIIKDLSQHQLNWQMHSDALSIGQMAIHVAGVEVSFVSQLLDLELTESDAKLKMAATDGSINDKPFPYENDEITPELVARLMERGRELVEPLITAPTDELRRKEIVSALGPVITGEGAFARLASHPFYHQGQAYLMRTSPDFPKD